MEKSLVEKRVLLFDLNIVPLEFGLVIFSL